MQTFKSQYGRKGIRVSDECPTFSITQRLARTHVGTSTADVESMVREQIAKVRASKAHDAHKWTETAEAEAVRFALWRHGENLAEYAWVMSGH